MVRITRVSQGPTLHIHINGEAGGSFVAEPATDKGPVFSEVFNDELAALMKADASLCEHFTFEAVETPVVEPKRRRKGGDTEPAETPAN